MDKDTLDALSLAEARAAIDVGACLHAEAVALRRPVRVWGHDDHPEPSASRQDPADRVLAH